jgi:glycine/D-amino acid oxidase-like deaminating enzyme/nitrite reductase/ring-hydroxylating ferredoxin subunit
MDREANMSLWAATAPGATAFPALDGDASTDVAVIGGGITGITTAMLLAEAGKSVIVLEAHRVGMGTTAHSTGNLYATAGQGLAEIEKKWDEETMKRVARSRSFAMDRVEALAASAPAESAFARRAFHWSAVDNDADSIEALEKERDACARAGLVAHVAKVSSLPLGTGPTLVIAGQAQFHPLRYVLGLAARISSRCRVCEGTPAVEVEADKGIVRTPRGTVRARSVVMATHTPKGFNLVQTELAPYREYAVAGEMSGSVPDGIFWTRESNRHSIRCFSDAGRRYLMVLGEHHKTGQEPDPEARYSALEDYLRRLGTNRATHRWSAQGYYPADGLPYIGLAAASENLYVATGFAADGLTYGTLAAHIVCDTIMGGENEFARLYDPTRFKPAKAAKGFLKENANTVREYVRDYAKLLKPESLADLGPGDGRIVEVEGKRCGVHRTRSGELLAVSPYCTHLRCIVHWNKAEQSWDCPCHGSRFTAEGEVIEGPAIEALDSTHISRPANRAA